MTDNSSGDILSGCRRVSAVLNRVGDKWTVLAIVVLQGGPRRFNDIKRSIDGISQQMLSRTLKLLERDGMVVRTTFPTMPPQVQYELSELGKSLSVPVLAVGKWAYDHLAEIDAAQTEYDRRPQSR
jgi:DNA-binding HxlR family transcriptional regulator